MTDVAVQSRETLAAPPTATSPAAIVELIDVSKSIDDRLILREVTFSIPPAQIVAVLGANGTGKSTLLKVVSTLAAPTSGEVRLFGRRAGVTSVALRQRVGLIGHQPMLYRDLSANENLSFFAKLYGIANPDVKVAQMLQMAGLSDRASEPVRNFSRGMVQRVAIARALLHDPELLLADEPFDGLDAPSADSLEHLLAELGEAGKTIVLVNHDIEQSLRLADRAIVLRGGRVVVDQPTHRLYERELLSEVRP